MLQRTLVLFAALTALAGTSLAADKELAAYDTLVVSVFFSDSAQVAELAREKALWQVDKVKGFVLMEVTHAERELLEKQGYRVEIDERRTRHYHDSLQRLRESAEGVSGIPGFSCYRTVAETYASAAALVTSHPGLAEWVDIGDSWDKANNQGGHDLRVLKITNEAIGGTKPKLFAMSAVHAREYTTAELNTRFAEYLLANYDIDADVTWLVDHHEIHLSLQSNPDGRERAQTGLSWRKNTNQNYCGSTSNSRGADLNRNFGFQWGCCQGSSGSPCSETYRGPTPSSEPESAAIQNYVRSIFPDQRGPALTDAAPADASGVFLDIHSFSELVLWPWGFTNTVAPNGTGLRTLGRKFAYFNDYEPQQAIDLYATDGTTDDFGYGELGLPAYTFELGTSFFQDCGVFENTILPDNLSALIYAARVARAPYLLPAGPDALNPTLSANVVAPGDIVTLSAVADDTRFSTNNGTEPTQAIASANWYLDTPPWSTDPLPAPLPMAAADGTFNSNSEALNATINTAALANGRHTLFVQATDANGNAGPVSAAFLYVLDPAVAPKISGTIVAADSGDALAATVSVGTFSVATDPATGGYSLLVPEGNYDLTVTPNSSLYSARTVAGITAAAGSSQSVSVALHPYCAVLSDDVESGSAGWSAQSPWAITTELAMSPTHSWTDSPGGNYVNNRNVSLTSPVLDLSAVSGVRIRFAQICDTEATYDFCNVEVSGGAGWQTLAAYDGLSNAWEQIGLDAPMLAGQAAAQFRFRFTSDVSITENGWHVDDIVIEGAGLACVGPDSDADGVADSGDNCRDVANTNQRDTNADGFGNACDADLDNSGIVNFGDLVLLKSVFLGASPDADFDGDGQVNFGDLAYMKSVFLQAPGP